MGANAFTECFFFMRFFERDLIPIFTSFVASRVKRERYKSEILTNVLFYRAVRKCPKSNQRFCSNSRELWKIWKRIRKKFSGVGIRKTRGTPGSTGLPVGRPEMEDRRTPGSVACIVSSYFLFINLNIMLIYILHFLFFFLIDRPDDHFLICKFYGSGNIICCYYRAERIKRKRNFVGIVRRFAIFFLIVHFIFSILETLLLWNKRANESKIVRLHDGFLFFISLWLIESRNDREKRLFSGQAGTGWSYRNFARDFHRFVYPEILILSFVGSSNFNYC